MIFFISWTFIFLFQSFYWPQLLPTQLDNQKIVVTGTVDTPPIQRDRYTQFGFSVQSVENFPNINRLVFNLSSYKKGMLFSKGDKLKAVIKVKQFRDYLNPGSPSYGRLHYAKGFSGKAYLVKVINHQRAPPDLLFKLRRHLFKKIQQLYDDKFSSALMSSILIGNRALLTKDDWTIFQLTGTSHLIAISGLHVGLIVLVFYLTFSFLWRLIPGACSVISGHQLASFVALVAAFLYSVLSGFGIPTQRAFLMSLVFLSSAIVNKKTHVWHSYQLSLFLVLLLNPFSIYFAGFYLSFFVVFILIWFSTPSRWNILQVQLKIWLLLMPISFYIFHYYSLVSIPANLLSIPLLSFIILPLGFFSVLMSYISGSISLFIAKGVSFSLVFLKTYLSFLSTLDWFSFYYVPNSLFLIVLVTGMLFYILDSKKMGASFVTLILSVGLLFPYQTTVETNKAKIAVLDVGQGLSIFIKTKSHALLYDTGDRFSSGLDLGTLVVIPYLLLEGIYKLDHLIISHEDMDHRGGFESIIKNIKVGTVLRNGEKGFKNCHETKPWRWDGVTFYFISVPDLPLKSQNNRSCVLMVENNFQRLMIPGDIEKEAELALLNNYQKSLKSTVLISPHHGSKTSSSLPFLTAISPRYVFISSGKNNRYRFPHQSVLNRYQFLGIEAFNTGVHGMISWELNDSYDLEKPYYFEKVK